jgi:predicted amidophosphoribosyltransferase
MIFFCPNCWSRVKEHETICHECRADIERLDHLSYIEKLVNALTHSVRTTRIRAAYINTRVC